MAQVDSKPQVGDGATQTYGGDCYPMTVVRVSASGKTIWVQADRVTCLKQASSYGADDAEFRFEPNPDAPCRQATLRKDGKYHVVGTKMGSGGIAVGSRNFRQDPHF